MKHYKNRFSLFIFSLMSLCSAPAHAMSQKDLITPKQQENLKLYSKLFPEDLIDITEKTIEEKKYQDDFFKAIKEGNLKRAQELIQQGICIDAVDEDDATALDLAIQTNQEEIALYLIHNGANVNRYNFIGQSPLFHALRHYQTTLIPNNNTLIIPKALVEHGSDFHTRKYLTKTILEHAKNNVNQTLATFLDHTNNYRKHGTLSTDFNSSTLPNYAMLAISYNKPHDLRKIFYHNALYNQELPHFKHYTTFTEKTKKYDCLGKILNFKQDLTTHKNLLQATTQTDKAFTDTVIICKK
jgi:hypothetical protein